MTFTFFFLSDMNHFSSRVQKAASRDMWDIGLLIHNIFIADVTREEMIWMLSLQCSHFDTQLIDKTFVNRCQLCCKCRWWPHIFMINCNINIPDICNSWLARTLIYWHGVNIPFVNTDFYIWRCFRKDSFVTSIYISLRCFRN